jgi:copper homeostasis protein
MSLSTPVSVEVCAYSLYSCLAADLAGAQRVELCASPWEGGTTPSAGLVEQALKATSLEIHAMVRPRGGDFVYDDTEKQTMLAEARSLVSQGVHGLVVGALKPAGDLDVSRGLSLLISPLSIHLSIHLASLPSSTRPLSSSTSSMW